ncbi:hypothetical protein NN561_018372 [Cricetulus griseus]
MTEPVACAACLFGGGAGPGPQQQPLTAGKGNFQDLTRCAAPGQPTSDGPFSTHEKELGATWVVEVFHRFTDILHVFHCNAPHQGGQAAIGAG